MNKFGTTLTLIAALALGTLMFPSGVSAAAQTFHLTGYTAGVDFQTWDSTGCVVTEGFVMSSNPVGKSGSAQPYTFAIVDRYDVCTGELLSSEYGQTASSNLKSASNLTSASLQATIPAVDQNGNTGTLTVNLTWTGSGPVMKGVFTSHFSGGGFSETSHSSGQTRNATATGSISDGVMNYAHGASTDASIGKVSSSDVTISH
jgi:hypothetical protein